MRKTLLALLVSMLLSAFFGTGHAGAENRKVTVVYTEWFPYTYTENGRPAGFEIEILSSVLEGMDLAPQFVSLPWKRCLSYLETGKADLLVSMLRTPEREVYACYPEENISDSRTSLFARVDSKIAFSGDYAALKNYSVGVILGFSYGEAFDRAVFAVRDESADARVILEKLLAGRIDLGAENEAVVSAEAGRLGVRGQIRFLSPPIHSQKLYVGFSKAKDLDGTCEVFSRKLAVFKRTGRYLDILKKYGADHARR